MQIPAVINEIFNHVLLGNRAVGRLVGWSSPFDHICLDRLEGKGLRQGSLKKQGGPETVELRLRDSSL